LLLFCPYCYHNNDVVVPAVVVAAVVVVASVVVINGVVVCSATKEALLPLRDRATRYVSQNVVICED